MSGDNSKNILNLAGDLTDALKSYFEKNSMSIITRDQASNYEDLDYILVSTGEEAKQAAKDFSADKNEIQVVCLGQVNEIKDFLLFNGRLIIEPEFVESELGEFILNKFFNKNYNIHLDESYSTLFSSPSEFKITNHLAAGLYIDEISNSAFKNGFNIVALRSFMDHLIYYFTYLKQAGLAGIPYEIEYDNTDSFFVVNVYCPVRNFVAEYMIDSFGPVNSKDPLQYLLGIVAKSTDFLEVTYIENPARLVLTAAWGKDEKKRLNGLSFNNVLTTAQTIVQLDKAINSFEDIEEKFELEQKIQEELKPQILPGGILEMVVSTDENSILNKEPEKASNIVAFAIAKFEDQFPDRSINEIGEEEFETIINNYSIDEPIKLSQEDKEHLLDRVQKNNITQAYDEEIQRVRENLEDEEEILEDLQDTLTDEVSKRIAGHMDAETLNRILSGPHEKELIQKIGGSEDEADDFVTKIKAQQEEEKPSLFTTNLGSSFENKAGEFNARISSASPEDKKEHLNWFAKSSIREASKKSGMDLKVQSFLEENATKKIESELERYATKVGQTLDTLSQQDLIVFKDTELPQLIESVFVDDNSIKEFKQKLEQGFEVSGPYEPEDLGKKFETKFKNKLEAKLESLDILEKENDKYVVTSENVSEEKMQKLIQATMKEAMDEEFKLEKANKDNIDVKEKEIIDNLSYAMEMEINDVSDIVKKGTQVAKDKEIQTVVDSLFKEKPGVQEKIIVKEQIYGKDANLQDTSSGSTQSQVQEDKGQENQANDNKEKASKSLAEAELIKKLKKQEHENKELAKKVKAMEIQLKTATATNDKINEVKEKALKEAEAQIASENQANDKKEDKTDKGEISQLTKEESEKINEQLDSGQPVSSEDAERIKMLLKKEQQVLQIVKETESNLKKVKLQATKQESLFKSEITRANRALKGKDMVVEKLKESMTTVVNKKDNELRKLTEQVEDLNKRLNSDETIKLKERVRNLRQDVESNAKTAEMYKNKLESFVKSKNADKKTDNSAILTAENRQLKGLKTQMENKVNSLTRENRSWSDRYNKLKVLENKFRGESTTMKTQVKDLENKLKAAKDTEARLMSLMEKAKSQHEAGANSKEVDHLKGQITQLQGKLKDMVEKQKAAAGAAGNNSAAGGTGSAKEKHLEKTNKMLQVEITKARGDLETFKKDSMKMKAEATGLKNKIKVLEKEVERHKRRSAAGGKKAA